MFICCVFCLFVCFACLDVYCGNFLNWMRVVCVPVCAYLVAGVIDCMMHSGCVTFVYQIYQM
jgi:hypothetical protein